MRKIKQNIIIILTTALLFSACTKKDNNKTVEEAIPVKTAQAIEKSYDPVLNYSGSVQAAKEANLGASLPGKVEKIFVKEGQNVSEGQVIAQLSDELFTQVQIEYKAIEKDFNRVSQLFSKGSISEMEFDHLKAKLEATKEKFNLLRKNTQIIAPFAGTVVEILVKEGENFSIMPALNPGYSHASGVVRLMQLNTVKVQIQVNEKDIAQLKKGIQAEIKCDAYPNESFSGVIEIIHPILSNLSRTTTVDIIVNNSSKKLMPGMFTRVSLKMPTEKGLFIPRFAMMKQSGTNESFVFVFDNGKAVKKVIKPLKSVGDEILVEGVQVGDQVITAGKTKLMDGTAVQLGGGAE
ncbi:MAG TPA: efflux RND transporter periplasmic adaptor subunit [Candidatus Cloacimonadota bacterium]|nr:efflux RND transporter periplasmic adaptor subunit [Candidatus Cloacimonadota bacterium]